MNKNEKNPIFKNIIYLFYSTVTANVLNATTLILLANYFTSKSYGIFSVALALSMIMNFFTDLGVSNTFLREGSKDGGESVNFTSYIKIRILFLVSAIMIFTVGIHLFYQEKEMLHMMYYLMIPIVIGLMLQSIGITYFQLTERMQYIASIKMFSSFALIVSTLISMSLKVDVHIAALLYGFSYLAGGIYSLFELKRRTTIDWSTPFQKQLFSNLSPFLISGLFIMLIPQLGPLVLEKTLVLSLVGLFAVAYRIPSALYQIPGVIAGAFYPLLFKYYNQRNLEEHTRLNILQTKMMSFIGMCLTVTLFYLASYLITVLFGDDWGAAIQPLQILSFIVVLQGFNIAMADGLTTRRLQSRRTIVQFIAIVAGLGAFYFMSIAYQVIGAAYAVVVIEVVSFIGYVLANPARKITLSQVLIPYGAYFSVSFILFNYMLNTSPYLALVLTLILITTMIILFDREIRAIIVKFTKNKLTKTYLIDRRKKGSG